ncbi:cob(I)yrinic acid a,c-diamide adenosyltransferase [Pisciglobus halotolerans]|uniref:Corrinoid adenosyltransferase n=1 Tax=Pisciglobus halotolerans TaxID=745365 RepID=A0A1I3C6Z5_9LACT|nr:cob(I)yrinic acid a,c-diamide adenosyltransferase [Pisciglobus halotolerans]SFH69949.1 ATP:cob(I)alamin adenosyltransferase [Pisciglobus halotolerans]
MQLYTKRGDYGNTNLIGQRTIPKDNIRVETYGTLDELNSLIGVIVSQMDEEDNRLKSELIDLQHLLFDCGTDLATFDGERPYKVKKEAVEWIEEQIDVYAEEPPIIEKFVIPGGHPVASLLHLARTVTRRAEHLIVTLNREEKINTVVAIFVNRLSDYLFALARIVNHRKGVAEPLYERGGKVFHPELKKEQLPKTHY